MADNALTATVPYELAIGELYPDPRQPRKAIDDAALKELAASIEAHGILEPLLVHAQQRKDGKTGYTIIAGERRWRAAKLAGLKTVPVIIRSAAAHELAEMMLVENLQREDLTALELAAGYAHYLQATGKSQAELARALGLDEGTVSHHLGLLRLPKEVQTLIAERVLTFAHGRELARLGAYPGQLSRVGKHIAEQIRWGKVPTTRTVKHYVDSALDQEKRRRQAQAARKKRPRTTAAAEAQRAEQTWQQQQAERARRRATRRTVLDRQLPNVAKTFTADPLHALVRKIPPRLAALLAREIRPGWWDEQQTLGQRLVRAAGGGPRAKIAAALWLRTRWSSIDRRLEQMTKAALLVAAKAAKSATLPKRKGGGK